MQVTNKYLYIHSWIWKDMEGEKIFDGRPKSGRVYLADEQKAVYRIILKTADRFMGIDLPKELMVSEGNHESWDCNIELVTARNLLDLGISTPDLKMMAEEEEPQEPVMDKDALMEKLLDDLGSSLYMLNDFDEDMYEAIVKITTRVSDALSNPQYVSLLDGLAWSPQTAKISNVTLATNHLEAYLNNNKESDISSLLDAIFQISIEIIRKHKILKLGL